MPLNKEIEPYQNISVIYTPCPIIMESIINVNILDYINDSSGKTPQGTNYAATCLQ